VGDFTPRDHPGTRRLGTAAWRPPAVTEAITYLCLDNSSHAPEVVTEVCRELGVPFRTHGYHPAARVRAIGYASRKRSIADASDCGCNVDHGSPTCSTRFAMPRKVNAVGRATPSASSSHVHGAETGAPGLGRTA